MRGQVAMNGMSHETHSHPSRRIRAAVPRLAHCTDLLRLLRGRQHHPRLRAEFFNDMERRMSRTYSLVCHATNQKIWIGQGSKAMTTFYSGDTETMQRLGRFLEATRGQLLVLVDDEYLCEDYEEFEPPPDADD